ncbi:MAG: hypothetical protein RLZZ546_2206 [Bacteroidota bacterium]
MVIQNYKLFTKKCNFGIHPRKDILLIICGSAASWIIKKVLQNKGGLHNRVSEKILLQPFTLFETEKFLIQKGIKWSRYDIAQLYLTTGGIPYYLDSIRKGENVSQFIDRACFKANGVLYHEFDELYSSLFANSHQHQLVVSQLAKVRQGLTREQLIQKTKLSSGGTFSTVLEELEESGFLVKSDEYSANINAMRYKLIDNFTIFYFKFMINKNKRITESWTKKVTNASWLSWSGFAFERMCFLHIRQIKRALGLEVVASEVYTWSSKEDDGAQIDMLIERADQIIHVCEIKFTKTKFAIDKTYASNIRNKLSQFESLKQNKKKVMYFTMITPYGVVNNEYYKELVQCEVVLNDLFLK